VGSNEPVSDDEIVRRKMQWSSSSLSKRTSRKKNSKTKSLSTTGKVKKAWEETGTKNFTPEEDEKREEVVSPKKLSNTSPKRIQSTPLEKCKSDSEKEKEEPKEENEKDSEKKISKNLLEDIDYETEDKEKFNEREEKDGNSTLLLKEETINSPHEKQLVKRSKFTFDQFPDNVQKKSKFAEINAGRN